MNELHRPLVSVIIPTYNCEAYIKNCIASILDQSLHDIEIIIVDDASTDNTYNMLVSSYNANQQIRIIKLSQNSGTAAARNEGICHAHGMYIAFIDADDFVAKDFLKVLYTVANNLQADVVSMGYTEINLNPSNNKWEPGRAINVVKNITKLSDNIADRLILMSNKRLIGNAWGKLFSTELIKKNNLMFENIEYEDVLFYFLFLYYAKTYILLPHNLYCFRQTPTSKTHRLYPNKPYLIMKQTIHALRHVNTYIENMDKLKSNLNLCYEIRKFFCDIYVEYCFLRSCSGLTYEMIRDKMSQAIQEEYHDDAFFVQYFLERYLKTIFKIPN